MKKPANTKENRIRNRRCIDVQLWRVATPDELRKFLESRSADRVKPSRRQSSVLAVRQHLRPVDVYCYLKARFGKPNGIQEILRMNTSDNWIHWDFNLRVDDGDVYICGMSREVHFMLSECLSDEDWRDLILAIKADYKRVAKEKTIVLKSLERWSVFQNKFNSLANVCAELHGTIEDNIGGYKLYRSSSFRSKKESNAHGKQAEQLAERAAKLHKSCIQLSLLTPVLAEAFLNLAILALCKKEVRANNRQFDALIRSHIDTKVFDLFYKCDGFARPIDHNNVSYKNFKRIMDKRNHVIHGNCDPEAEQVEQVYFDGRRPLFSEPGDHIGKFFAALVLLCYKIFKLKDLANSAISSVWNGCT